MNFKKALLFSITVLLLALPVFGQSEDREKMIAYYNTLLNFSDSDFIIPSESGDFVVYENNYADNSMLMTVIHVGERRYLIQTFNKKTYLTNKFILLFNAEESEIEIEGISVESGDFGSTDLQLAQTDLLRIFNSRSKIDVTQFPEEIIKTEIWDELDTRFEHRYRYWIPVSNLFFRIDRKDSSNSVKLVRFGNINSLKGSNILDFKGVNTTFDNSPYYRIPSAESAEVTMDGLKLSVDGNWGKLDDSNTIIIAKEGERYASININTVKSEELPELPEQFFSWYMTNSGSFILPDSVEITDFKGTPVLKCSAFNEGTLEKNRLTIMLFDRGDYKSILTLSAYENFYNVNRDYFEKILF